MTPLLLTGRMRAAERAVAASDRITLGFIGTGDHGINVNLKSFLEQDDAQVVAVCDVFATRRERARQLVDTRYGTTGCRAYADFRDLLAAPDIDAVVISTPDHWHVPISILAVQAGKDVMCEKPTYTISEGRALVDLVRKKQAVFQVGLEDRSVIQYHMLAEWVRNGAIGQLHTIHVGLPPGRIHPREEPAPVPAELDYDLWTGPASLSPYTPNRTEQWHWRCIRDYSGGTFTDWGSHLLDTAQVANVAEASGPVAVEGHGDYPQDAMSTTPSHSHLRYRYANGVEMIVQSTGTALRFEGSNGWVGNRGWRGRLEASDHSILQIKYAPGTSKLWPRPPSEHRNFLNCVKSRQPTTYTADAGHRLSSVMHIGNIAMVLGRKLRWDPQAEAFLGDERANQMRSRPARAPWQISTLIPA